MTVRNLPYNVNWQKLKDRFRDVGLVGFVEVLMANGKSMGVGHVRLRNLADVARAVKYLDKSKFGGRNIVVVPHRISTRG